jgi:hypothetical protein
MIRTPRRKTEHDEYSEAEIVRRRDEAITRALRTPPTRLKDMKKKRKAKASAASSKKRDDD